jgi:hypothetical protein
MAKPAAHTKPTIELDLTAYTGLWVAMVRGAITGVGITKNDARLAPKHQRPKEEPKLFFVSPESKRE